DSRLQQARHVALQPFRLRRRGIWRRETRQALAVFLISPIEERLIVAIIYLWNENGAAKAEREILPAIPAARQAAELIGEGIGVECLVPQGAVRRAVDAVLAGLHHVVENAALRASELGAHFAGLNPKLLQCFDRN